MTLCLKPYRGINPDQYSFYEETKPKQKGGAIRPINYHVNDDKQHIKLIIFTSYNVQTGTRHIREREEGAGPNGLCEDQEIFQCCDYFYW